MSAFEDTLDQMEAVLDVRGGKLLGPDRIELFLNKVDLDVNNNGVRMEFAVQFPIRNKMTTRIEGGSVGKQKPLPRILKHLAKLWLISRAATTGEGVPHHVLKDVKHAVLPDMVGRWPKMEQFARDEWDAAYKELRRRRKEAAMARVRTDLTFAMRSGLELEDIQDAWRELIVLRVQES